MIEENALIQLMDGMKSGNAWIITGVIILLLVPLVRNAVLPEIEGTASHIVSSLAAVLGGVAVLLASGQSWWSSVILGLFAGPTSAGLVPLIRAFIRLLLRKKGPLPTDKKPIRKKTFIGPGRMTLFLLIIFGAGCGAFQNQPCGIEKQLVNSVGVGLTATETAIGENGNEHYNTAMTAARGVQLLGRQAVRACELARDGAAWQQWVMLALETVGAVVGVIEGASGEIAVPAAPELHRAMEVLRNESNAIINLDE